MAISKEKAYYRAITRTLYSLIGDASTRYILKTVVRSIAVAMKSRVSILTLDSERKNLIHQCSWGLPHNYIHKGLISANNSLGDTYLGEPVVVKDVAHDKRIQYPKETVQAGIKSMIGIPLIAGDISIGSLRVYTKEHYEFTNQDIKFLTTMTGITSIALNGTSTAYLDNNKRDDYTKENTVLATQTRKDMANFAHPSEKEFADILDFYNIEWIYEPRAFALKWQDDRAVEMFTPDFYLPKLDLYIELTTLRQKLVTEKNRKLRRLRELYPDVNITLLYRKDFERLLAKYGQGPLAQTKAHGVGSILYSAAQIQQRVGYLAKQISIDYKDRRPVMVGIQRGFLCFMADLIRLITVPLDIDFMAISNYSGEKSVIKITKDLDIDITGRNVLIIEDIIDTGMTLSYLLNHLKAKKPDSIKICALFDRPARRIADVKLDYVGFQIPDEFIVGYGLDYQEEYRNLPFVGIVDLGHKKENQSTDKKKSPK